MKNQKELQPILTAIFALNRCSENTDPRISQILDYAFRTLYGSNTNLLILATVGYSYKEILPTVKELLEEQTNFEKYNNFEMFEPDKVEPWI